MSTHLFLFCINEASFLSFKFFFYLAFFDLASGEGFLESNLFLSVDPSPAEHIHM